MILSIFCNKAQKVQSFLQNVMRSNIRFFESVSCMFLLSKYAHALSYINVEKFKSPMEGKKKSLLLCKIYQKSVPTYPHIYNLYCS